MKKWALMLVLLPCAAYGQLRETAFANHLIDGWQTMQIHGSGFAERNPLVRPYIDNKPLIGAYFLATGYLVYRGIESLPREYRDVGYLLWAVNSIVLVRHNQKNLGTGYAVVLFKQRF